MSRDRLSRPGPTRKSSGATTEPPAIVGGCRLVAWTPIDERHLPTEASWRVVAGQDVSRVAALAICQTDDGFYLFDCDAGWGTLADTWHPTLEEAKQQAEFEYEGVRDTWHNV